MGTLGHPKKFTWGLPKKFQPQTAYLNTVWCIFTEYGMWRQWKLFGLPW